MIPHKLTALAYIVIGGLVLLMWWRLHRLSPIALAANLGPFLTDKGLAFAVKSIAPIRLLLVLFAAFILACAVDHLAHGHSMFLAEIEAGVSVFTAVVVVALEWKFNWKR